MTATNPSSLGAGASNEAKVRTYGASASRARRRARVMILGLGAFLLTLTWAGLWSHILTERAKDLASARLTASNLSRAVAEHVAGMFQAADQSLVHLIAAYERSPASFDIDAALRDTIVLTDMSFAVAVFGPDGRSILSTVPGPSISIADRDNFKAHAANDARQVIILEPMQSRLTGRPRVVLSRRINRPDGGFGGVMGLSFEPQSLSRFFDTIDVGPHGYVSVVGLDGVIRARSGPEITNGRRISIVPQLEALSRSEAAIIDAKSSIDGIDRTVALRRVPGFPLLIGIGLSRDDIIAESCMEAIWLIASGGFISIMVIAAIGLLLRSLAQRDALANSAIRAEARFRSIFEASIDLVMVADADGRIRMLSPSVREILGYDPRHELASLLEIVHPDEDERLARQLRADTLDDSAPASSVYRFRHRDGSWRELEIVTRRTVAIADLNGVLINARDVTERRAAARALEDSRRQLLEAQRLGKLGYWNYDFATGQVRWSDQVYDMIGLPADTQVSYEQALAVLHPEDRADHLARLAEGIDFAAERRLVRADGTLRWLQTQVHFHHDADGQPTGTFGVLQDITERKLAEETLREKEAQLRAIMDNAPFGIYLKDRDRRYRMVNKCFAAWHDLDLVDLLGKSDTESDIDPVPEAFARLRCDTDREVLERGVVTSVERGGLPERPEPEHLLITKFPTFDAEGDVVGIAGFIVDITERKRVEAQLAQVQKMEAMGQIAGGLAHDLNNILLVIIGNLELIEEELGRNPGLHKLIAAALDSAARGADLTRSLVAFSRKQPIQPKPTDANRLVGQLAEMLRRTLESSIEINAACARDLWVCEADPAQLEASLLNLAINARDAMPGGGRLTVETANVRVDAHYARIADIGPGDYVKISAADTGVGMSPEIAKRIFEPFFTTKEIGRGTGLGLSMVHGFVKQSRGHVTVYSEPDRGTTVSLYLPRSDRPIAPEIDTALVPVSSMAGWTALIVEDDENVRQLASATLGSAGFAVVTAGSGPEALQILESDRAIDLLLTDMVLPGGMDGRRVAEMARRLKPDIATVYMSGYTKEALATDGWIEPQIVLLTKPFRKAELIAVIQAAMTMRPGAPVARPADVTARPPDGGPGAPRRRALVVDDLEEIRQLLTVTLRRIGWEADARGTANEALALLTAGAHEFDIVITDETMPGMHGIELIEAIKAKRPGLACVLCTGAADHDQAERARAAGCDAVLLKPIKRAELAALLDRLEQDRIRLHQPDP